MSNSIETGYINMSINIMDKIGNSEELKEYFLSGNEDLAENTARLLTIATTTRYDISPVEALVSSINQNALKEVPSIFLNSRLNNNDFFEKDYDNYMGEGASKRLLSLEQAPTDIYKNIGEYYSKKISEKMNNREMDIRLYEPLMELFNDNITKSMEKGSVINGNKERHQ